ncbi:hypothetical protein ACK1JC_14755 [Acinetobacter sp. TY2]|uniref:hypothetical protein n=1 Tax=Acinetobacter sp. TY2 TaxID=3387403 RepID=UPI003917888C
MSSRLYRKEVWPFISDAARNVYMELENRINGHLKETDFVSYSQLQGSDLEGARKMGRTTVSNALQELIKLGVVTVLDSGKKGMKSYCINEISLKDRFTSKTSPITRLVPLQDRSSPISGLVTSPVIGHTIDTPIDSLEDDDKACEEKFTAQENRPLNFIEYQTSDRTAISFPDLCKKYPAQIDFQDQAKASFPNHSPDRIFENLKKMAQWSLDKSNHTPQKWMSIWLSTFMKNLPSDAELKAEQDRKAQKQTQTTKTEKPKRVSRFGQFLKSDSAPQNQGEIRDV